MAKCWPNPDETRQNVFPRRSFIRPPAPEGGQSANDHPLSIRLLRSLTLSLEEYYQHIHPSDISRMHKKIHTYRHTQIHSTFAYVLTWLTHMGHTAQKQPSADPRRVNTHFPFQNSILFLTHISRPLSRFFRPYLTSQHK